MKTFALRVQINLVRCINLTSSTAHPSFRSPIYALSRAPTRITTIRRQILGNPARTRQMDSPVILELKPESQQLSRQEIFQVSSNGYSKFVLLGAVSIGFVLLLMGMDDQKALAFGPEGPLAEEFWDNVRRYALYALTVSTGAIYAVLQPIIELLKNPISAILILIIIGGSIYIVTQVLSAMVGVTDFSYDYGY